MCIGYKKNNDITKKNSISIIDDLLDELKFATYFLKIDLKSGHHQIRIHTDLIPLIAFRTHEGLYELKVMPFGLTNTPATFQSLMNSIFKLFLRKFILVFFDNILIYSKDWNTCLEHLHITFQVLHKHQLHVKLAKYDFAIQKKIKVVATDPKKIVAMLSWPSPKKLNNLWFFRFNKLLS
jgi:Reverse transcriptase (RNA-dependent DNA polymerase)